MKKRKNTMIHQMIWNVAMGIALMEIAGAVTYVIDGTITSRFLGSVALAANGIAGICFTVFAVISGVLSAGASELCSVELGRGNTMKSSEIFSVAMFVSTVVAALVALMGLMFGGTIASWIGTPESTGELYGFTSSYIRGFFMGAPGHILIAVMIPAVQLCGKNKRILASIGVLTLVDIVGDLLNVLVFHGGMFGMGVATSISYYASMLVLAGCFRHNQLFQIRFRRLDFSSLFKIVKIGLPRATKRVGNILRPLVMNRMILVAGGTVAMSAFSVEQNIRYVVESVGVGIGGSIFLLAGMFLGEKDYDSLKRCSKISQKYIFMGVGGLAAVYFLLAPFIARLYVDVGAAPYTWAVGILRCHAVSLPFLAYNEFYQNLIQAQKKYTLTHIHTFCNKFVCIIVLCFVLAPGYGVWGLWLSIPLSEVLLMLLVLAIRVIKNKKNHNPEGVFALTDAPREDPQRHLEIQISEKEQLPQQMEKIRNFCAYNQLKQKQLYYLELFMEEIVVIILKQGFSGEKSRRKMIDIRIYIDADTVIIRTRDNGAAITAAERMKLIEKLQEGEYMGLQMVYKLAEDVQYVTTMNMNNFIISLPKE